MLVFPSYKKIKNLPANFNAGDIKDIGLIPGLGRSPGEGKWKPTPVFLLGKSHGQRSLVGCSPWGPRELDTTAATEHMWQQNIEHTLCAKFLWQVSIYPEITLVCCLRVKSGKTQID